MFQQPILIGIPTLNGSDRLWRCLHSIADCTRWHKFADVRVVVCDDGSGEEELRKVRTHVANCGKLRERCNLELVENDGRWGIARSWNRLARSHPSEVLVLVNDDVEVVEHWLEVLTWSVTKNPRLGMVCLNTYLSLSKGQHARHLKVIKEDGTQGTVLPHVAVPVVDYHEAHLLTGGGKLLSSQGSIFAVRTALYEEVGGFDERFFCYYEEVDFGVRLRQKGYLSAVASFPLVYHLGGATNSDEKNLDAQKIMAESRAKFIEKHGAEPDKLRDTFSWEWGLHDGLTLNEWNTQIGNWE